MGRPSVTEDQRLTQRPVGLSAAQFEAVDRWARHRGVRGSFAAAVRDMVDFCDAQRKAKKTS
ncbi:MAG: hypothetical protein GY716_16075 [bacterium]|nr:hypothetical protein [bacterium]